MWVKWVGKKKLKKNNLNADVENCGSFKGFGYIYIYIYIDGLNHQWKGCRRTTYWTLPEARSVKLKCQRWGWEILLCHCCCGQGLERGTGICIATRKR